MNNLVNPNDTVYEVNKQIEVTPMMQLIDLNGTRVNFQSDFTVSVSDPTKQILVAIVNQNQLDEGGKLTFEPTDHTGKYSRRVTYLEKTHLNHYIAVKKMDKDEIPIECSVIVKLKEIKPREENVSQEEISKLTSISNETRKQLETQLNTLKQMPVYNQNIIENTNKNMENNNKNMENYIEKPEISEISFADRLKYDPYYTTAFICLVLFVFILFLKILKK